MSGRQDFNLRGSEEDPEMGAEETQTWCGERTDGFSCACPSLGVFLHLYNVGAKCFVLNAAEVPWFCFRILPK